MLEENRVTRRVKDPWRDQIKTCKIIMLIVWMADNNRKDWAEGLRFAQSKRNRAFHTGIKRSPYGAMFGVPQRIGLADSKLSKDMYESIETEEELLEFLSTKKTTAVVAEVHQDDISADSEPSDRIQKKQKTIYVVCQETDAPYLCSTCRGFVHVSCGKGKGDSSENIICNRCLKSKAVTFHREGAREGLRSQAEKMLSRSNAKFPLVDVGQNIILRVPYLMLIADVRLL